MNRRRIAAFSIVAVVFVAIIIVGVIAPNAAAAEAATVSGEDPDLVLLHMSAALARETIARSLGSSSSATAAADTGIIEEVYAPAPVDAPPPSAPVTTTTTSANDNATNNNSDNNDKNLAYDGADLIEWINANGGFIHENARIGLDPTGMYRGVFVKNQNQIVEHNNEHKPPPRTMDEGIEEGDIIARIPW
jgi:hypothetical protein